MPENQQREPTYYSESFFSLLKKTKAQFNLRIGLNRKKHQKQCYRSRFLHPREKAPHKRRRNIQISGNKRNNLFREERNQVLQRDTSQLTRIDRHFLQRKRDLHLSLWRKRLYKSQIHQVLPSLLPTSSKAEKR